MNTRLNRSSSNKRWLVLTSILAPALTFDAIGVVITSVNVNYADGPSGGSQAMTGSAPGTYNFRGDTLTMDAFTAGGSTYTLSDLSVNNLQVFVRRDTPQQGWESFAQIAGAQIAGGPNYTDILGRKLDNAAQALTGYDFLTGLENTFQNSGPNGNGNIERIDFVFQNGMEIANTAMLTNYALPQFERDGNNQFHFAAITSVDASGNPLTFGPRIFQATQDWKIGDGFGINQAIKSELGANGIPVPGGDTAMYQTSWSRDVGSETNFRTNFTVSQLIVGKALTLADLGLASGQTFYGYAIFHGNTEITDVVGFTNAQLQDISNYISDSDGGLEGGGDLYGGGWIYAKGGTHWDLNGAIAGAEGATGGPDGANLDGIWDNSTTNNNWGNADGTIATDQWQDYGVAHFSAGTDAAGRTYTIEVNDTVNASGLDFQEGTARLVDDTGNNGEIHLNNIYGGEPIVNAETAAVGEIDVKLTGTDGFTKTGDGTVILSADNSGLSGTITVDEGNLSLTQSIGVDGLNNTIRDDTVVLVNSGATFELDGRDGHVDERIASVQDGSSGGGTVQLNENTLRVNGDDSSTSFSGNIDGGIGSVLVKEGTGVPTLTGDSQMEGTVVIAEGILHLKNEDEDNDQDELDDQSLSGVSSIIIEDGGTLMLGSYHQISNNANITISGGGVFNANFFSDTMSTLDIENNASGVLDFGTAANGFDPLVPDTTQTVSFANMTDRTTWETSGSGILYIHNWHGSWDGLGQDQLYFNSSFGAGAVSNIFFINPNNGGNNWGARVLASGEIVPTPEAPTVIGAALLIGWMGWHAWRRRSRTPALSPVAQPSGQTS